MPQQARVSRSGNVAGRYTHVKALDVQEQVDAEGDILFALLTPSGEAATTYSRAAVDVFAASHGLDVVFRRAA